MKHAPKAIAETLARLNRMKIDSRSRLLINRKRIQAALEELNLSRVTISYSGSGDSGQVDEVSLYRNEELVEIEGNVSIVVEASRWDDENRTWISRSSEKTFPLKDALREMAYDCLQMECSGWENNDGAQGEFTLVVPTNEFLLSHTTFYTESETSEYIL